MDKSLIYPFIFLFSAGLALGLNYAVGIVLEAAGLAAPSTGR
ncbi:hypothetical protein [Hydrogenispora ethanolica]|nr:hypothetical protein [Hydrogenispora ethanolica]